MITNNLSDTEYLEKFCECAKFMYGSGGNEISFIKDNEGKYKYLSLAYINGFYNSTDETDNTFTIEEDKYQQILNEVYEQQTHEIPIKQDEEIKESRKQKYFFYVDRFDKIGLIRKSPIINNYTNNVVGTAGYVIPFMLPNVSQLLYRINGIEYAKINKKLSYEMTPKQHMVLFLAIHHFSYTEISKIMTKIGHNISPGRVNEHLENLKYIFRVRSKDELIRKGIAMDYHLFIPRSFLKVGSIPCEDIVVISK